MYFDPNCVNIEKFSGVDVDDLNKVTNSATFLAITYIFQNKLCQQKLQ